MSELMEVYEPGDKFLTISTTGNARMWRVTVNGDIVPDIHPHTVSPPPPLKTLGIS